MWLGPRSAQGVEDHRVESSAMPEESRLVRSLRSAVAAAPEDVPLRLHLAELPLDAAQHDAAVAHAAVALRLAPGDALGGPPAHPVHHLARPAKSS